MRWETRSRTWSLGFTICFALQGNVKFVLHLFFTMDYLSIQLHGLSHGAILIIC